MAYTPTVWATGDTITAEKLNKAENGIAANDAAIAAIPAGLRLYGPYKASNSEGATIETKDAGQVTLSNIEDENGISVTYPADTTAIIIPCYLYSSLFVGCAVQDFNGPYVSDAQWQHASIMLYNGTDTDSTVTAGDAFLGFYSTVEFPQES